MDAHHEPGRPDACGTDLRTKESWHYKRLSSFDDLPGLPSEGYLRLS